MWAVLWDRSSTSRWLLLLRPLYNTATLASKTGGEKGSRPFQLKRTRFTCHLMVLTHVAQRTSFKKRHKLCHPYTEKLSWR